MPFPDVGRTPYFTVTAPVVIENGGRLTATTTVACELGLLTAVNVRSAVQLIRTGERHWRNAKNAEVYVFARATVDL